MNALAQTSSRLARIGIMLAVLIGTLLLDGFLVAWIWAAGVDFAIMDRVPPGASGFHINPLPIGYKWLFFILLASNIGLFYILTKRKWKYALGFAAGAIMPMGCLINILASS